MITEAQYLEAKRIVEEYEMADYETRQREAEDELNDDEPDDDYPEECVECGRTECVCYEASNCNCGAWVLGPKGFTHVSDCIC